MSDQSPIAPASLIPGSVTLDPAGIFQFAAVLHIVFAHRRNPVQGAWTPNHHALAATYIRHHQVPGVDADRIDTTDTSATYELSYPSVPGRAIGIRVRGDVPFNRCLEVRSKIGAYVPIDFSHVVVLNDG